MLGSDTITLLMIVTVIGFVLGVVYGKFVTNIKWRNNISSVIWKTIPKNMMDAVMTQNLSGYGDEAVYVLSVPAVSEMFHANEKQWTVTWTDQDPSMKVLLDHVSPYMPPQSDVPQEER